MYFFILLHQPGESISELALPDFLFLLDRLAQDSKCENTISHFVWVFVTLWNNSNPDHYKTSLHGPVLFQVAREAASSYFI